MALRIVPVLFTALVLLISGRAAADSSIDEPRDLRIAWFSELDPEHSYWRQNWAFARAAADDLGVELVPHYVRSDQVLYRQLLAERTARADSPTRVDGVIFLNIKRQGAALLDILEAGGVPAISNVLAMDYDEVGRPRERYRAWIGEIVDDEESNGYRLARALLGEADRLDLRAADGTIHLVAINGKASDSAAILRERGLTRALAERDDVTLHQTFYAPSWARAEGARFATVALRRYPETSVVWSANDDVLLGVLEAAEALRRSPGRDLLTGSIDGTLEVVRKVAEGHAVCTISGLTMHSGWAVVLLHDYLRGVDFEDDTGVVIGTRNTLVDRRNAPAFLERFGGGDWSAIDFTVLSKVRSPELERYSLSIETFLDGDPVQRAE